MKSISLLLAGAVAGVLSFWVALDRQNFCKGDLIRADKSAAGGMTKRVVRTQSYNGNYGQ
jgi:hypothetical protein